MPDDGKRLERSESDWSCCEGRSLIYCRGVWREAPGSLGRRTDDGKCFRACEKRLELQFRAKPKRGGFGGNGRHCWAGERILRHKRRFFDQKSIKKIIKIQHLFFIVFGAFWDPSWSLLGGQNRPKMGQVGLKTALETIFFEKRDLSRKALK